MWRPLCASARSSAEMAAESGFSANSESPLHAPPDQVKLEVLSFRAPSPGVRAENVRKTTELRDASELYFEVDFPLAGRVADATSRETLATHPAQYFRFAVRHRR
jgi:hypothetical protein